MNIEATLVPGKLGQFEVFVGDKLVVTKEKVSLFQRLLGNRGIPAEEKVLKLLESELGGRA